MNAKQILLSMVFVLGSGCHAEKPNVVTVKERYFTPLSIEDNVDSIAVWHDSNSQDRLLVATAKESHKLFIYDAQNGFPISEYGLLGGKLGQLNRPNGIAIADDFAFVVERDNHRVQVLHLPEMTPIGTFGSVDLLKPYGIYIRELENSSSYHVYVTDDYNTNSTKKPEPNPAGIRKRVKLYAVTVGSDSLQTKLLNAFGKHSGANALDVVESVMGDPATGRLMLADEDRDNGMEVHVFDLEGNDTGEMLGKGLFKFQPEGIALWKTSSSDGYWIFTDQGKEANHYHVFGRKSLKHLGSFQGERTLNTDGVTIDVNPSALYPQGLFYAIHFDSGVTAWSLADISQALGLKEE